MDDYAAFGDRSYQLIPPGVSLFKNKKTVSSYLIARSPVPVIIVSPTRMT